ncbi:uncharacterized protein LOC113294209 [Papaver somniferum]|uniref:uncharacterized protein LOC113294209 n=1 Tax=Papaver somniferum TaxID=3469 RepID=UPI000E6FA70B|nr:uncharacterized protein LOC113294209 [Papaver somniferum]
MNVSSVTKTGQVMGEVIAIEPKDEVILVKVRVNVDLSMPLRRGIKCTTNAGVTKWQQFFFERRPKGICTECYVINNSRGACKEDAIFLNKDHEKPYFVGKLNNIGKSISVTSSRDAPADEGILDDEESRLGKCYRGDRVSTVLPPVSETSSQSTMLNPNSSSDNIQLITAGKNQSAYADKGNQFFRAFRISFIILILISASMKVLSWNIQGFNTPATGDNLRDIIRTQDPDIIFLCETKLYDDKMKSLLAPFRYPNINYLQPLGLSGGFVLMWNNGFVCDIVSCENNMIRAAFQSDPSQPEWLLSCMYGYCNYAKKKAQWEFIKDIGFNISQPWVLTGDLNIHLLDNSSSGSSSSDGLVHTILQEIGLEDLGFLGKGHTWSNNNIGTSEKRSRIDMALVNVEWNMVFNDSKLTCAMEIDRAWEKKVQGSPGFKLVKKLQFTRRALSKWNKYQFGDINQKVDTLQQQLNTIQALPYSQDNTSNAIEVSKELDKWHNIQHELNKQKSRDNFVKDMDYNYKYFHNLTKRKRSRNNIHSLKDPSGNWIHSREDISSLLTDHFKSISIFGNPQLEDHHYLKIPAIITEEENRILLLPPINEEIF